MPKYQINWKINKYVLADTLARAVFIWKLLVVETKFQIDWKSKIFLLQYQKKKCCDFLITQNIDWTDFNSCSFSPELVFWQKTGTVQLQYNLCIVPVCLISSVNMRRRCSCNNLIARK